jgi:hypothetical protein
MKLASFTSPELTLPFGQFPFSAANHSQTDKVVIDYQDSMALN